MLNESEIELCLSSLSSNVPPGAWIEDAGILHNLDTVQALLETQAIVTVTDDWIQYQERLLDWVRANFAQPSNLPPSIDDLLKLQESSAFLHVCESLLTWNGQATDEQRKTASSFVDVHIYWHTRFPGSIDVPAQVWETLRQIAVSIAPQAVARLRHRRHATVTACRLLALKYSECPNHEALQELSVLMGGQA